MSRPSAMNAYLEAIYVLNDEGEQVIASKVADYLNVSRPTVSQTLQRMNQEGYVTSGEGKEILLTDEGRSKAEQIVRRHRLLERWLTDVLDLDWADAHVEAGRLENSVSELVEKRLATLLGNPTTCPHGNVIPGSGYVLPKGMPLSEVDSHQTVEVVRIIEVAEEDLDLLRFLHRTGLVPGARVVLGEQSRFEAGIPIEVKGETLSLQREIADRVLVRPIEAQA
ncbi:metal-dependent transcriptional regulator [Alicyclobacillus fodiniaquatilis]|uniref:Manganese transport regulator n=1 Tax=Alicyclobacillus fodiniaquatilis TaxID=1661150 RepID=A0ABW4JKD2_9BACL